MNFTAKDVQQLREKTGCGMMDCKKALVEADGNIEKAIDYLREKGLAAAQKKSGRIAAEGVIASYVCENAGVLVEVNSETDFVAKTDKFQAFAADVAKTIAEFKPADVDALGEVKFNGTDLTVTQAVQEQVLTIGENIKVRRFSIFDGIVVSYIHGGGRIGVMVKLDTDAATAAKEEFKEMAKDIAMQIAAINPLYLSKESVPDEELEKEKNILKEQVIESGKPAAIAEKIVLGKLGKFYKENCLLEQAFVKNDEITVAKYVEETAKKLGADIKVVDFVRLERGEGIEKKSENFADEVAGMIK